MHSLQANLDHGETIDVDILLSEIVGVFKLETQDEETTPSLQVAMLATTSRYEQSTQDVTVNPRLGGDIIRRRGARRRRGVIRQRISEKYYISLYYQGIVRGD